MEDASPCSEAPSCPGPDMMNSVFLRNLNPKLNERDLCVWLEAHGYTLVGPQKLVMRAICLYHRATQEPCLTVLSKR